MVATLATERGQLVAAACVAFGLACTGRVIAGARAALGHRVQLPGGPSRGRTLAQEGGVDGELAAVMKPECRRRATPRDRRARKALLGERLRRLAEAEVVPTRVVGLCARAASMIEASCSQSPRTKRRNRGRENEHENKFCT